MGYACPVCESPQADRRHLANHLAFTAMIHGGDHERWLDDHAPNWNEAGEDDLAARIAGDVREIPFPPESEHAADHAHENQDRVENRTGGSASRQAERHGQSSDIVPPIGPDERTKANESSIEAVLAEARELTERMAREEANGENQDRKDAETAGSTGDRTDPDRTESEDDE